MQTGEGSPWCFQEPGLVALCVTPEPKHHPSPQPQSSWPSTNPGGRCARAPLLV